VVEKALKTGWFFVFFMKPIRDWKKRPVVSECFSGLLQCNWDRDLGSSNSKNTTSFFQKIEAGTVAKMVYPSGFFQSLMTGHPAR
jgi:hypothetical protein